MCRPSLERLDERTVDRLERDDGVARVEHGRRRQVDLLARLCLDARVDVGLADHGGRQFDPVEDEPCLVAGLQVDDDPILLEDLDRVLHRQHRLDRLGPVDSVVAGERGREAEDDEEQSGGDHEAGDEQAPVELPLRRRLGDCGREVGCVGVLDGILDGLDGGVRFAHPSMMPAANATCAGGSVSPLWTSDTPGPNRGAGDRLDGRVLADRYRVENCRRVRCEHDHRRGASTPSPTSP